MKNMSFRKILIGIAITIIVGLIFWNFSNIIAYILISVVLSLIGAPLVDLLGKIEIKNIKIPKALRAIAEFLNTTY